MRAVRHTFVVAVVSACLAPLAAAQDWRAEAIPSVGLEIEAPSRLERLPLRLGEDSLYERARFQPKDRQDYVRSQYPWMCEVYEFTAAEPKDPDDDLPPGLTDEQKAELRKVLAQFGRKRHKTFREWLGDHKDATVVVDGKAKKGKAGRLDHVQWVWTKDGVAPARLIYGEAAVYTLGEREVAVVIEMPLEVDKPPVPKAKWKGIIDRMLPSGRALKADDGDDVDKKRDQYANTPARQQALAAAKQNIAGLQGWDYFTQPNYIVFYSWDFEKPDERSRAKKDALFYSSRLEKMRELYLGSYELDATGLQAAMPDPATIPSITAPVTGGAGKPAEPAAPKPPEPSGEEDDEPATDAAPGQPYSVFRLCATYDQFRKYGGSQPGVVGWYSPASKELVVFLGGDKMMGPGATETVTYHEGWHQFADFYFHPPGQKKRAVLHRWFDEGHGDYFGSFRWGSQGWKYVGSKMRAEDCKAMVRQGDYVPWKDILHWPVQRFYTDRPAYRYAQAYSMIDFLRRGEKEKGWQPRWGEVLDMYRKVVLVHGDAKLAVDTAFRGFTDDDWKAIEAAWKSWVSGPHFLKGQ
jgi:hypothetical protein